MNQETETTIQLIRRLNVRHDLEAVSSGDEPIPEKKTTVDLSRCKPIQTDHITCLPENRLSFGHCILWQHVFWAPPIPLQTHIPYPLFVG